MKSPKVSVIITTKNEEKNIYRILESIKNQSWENIEIIVVDNNSTDNTLKIAKEFTPNVYTKGPERSAQRNYGVSKSKGDFVLILDADMELSLGVIESCIKNINNKKSLIIPERTVGVGFMAEVRKFEREMYMGDPSIEVARFFPKKVFQEFEGYDTGLTGTEDYDLPKRIMDKYGMESIGWAKEWIMHHETGLTLTKQLKKKYYYASKSALYAKKHPDLISSQGNMLLRPAYFKNWKKFLQKPHLGVAFIVVKSLETISAVCGFISAVGIIEFIRTFFKMLSK